MTAAPAAAVTTATVATSTDAKAKNGSKKEYKAPAPSAPAANHDTEKALVYVRCRACNRGRAFIQFHHVVTLSVLFFLAYALLSVVLMVNNALDKEVSKTHVRIGKYIELKKNYTTLQEIYNGLEKERGVLSNKPEVPSSERRHITPLILQEYNADAEILRHSHITPETESTTQTETKIQKEVTTEKESEEVTFNTDEEKNQINVPLSLLPELVRIGNNKNILEKIKLCLESRKNCP